MKKRLKLIWAIITVGSSALMANTAPVSGTITTHCGQPMPGVEVHFGSGLAAITNQAGFYQIELPVDGIYEVSPFLEDDMINGVDSNDLQVLSLAMDGPALSPYQLMAADANASMQVSTFDLVLLAQTIGDIVPALSAPYWMFLPADYVFPDPANPWAEALPGPIVLDGIPEEGLQGLDFVGVKRGDLDCSASLSLAGPPLINCSGQVFTDSDASCFPPTAPQALSAVNLRFWDGQLNYFASTGQGGHYSVNLPPGTYFFQAISPNELWEACPPTAVTLEDGAAAGNVMLGLQPVAQCPYIFASVNATAPLPGDTTVYTIYYRNEGTAVAADAAVALVLDSTQTILNSSLPFTSGPDGAYVFELGDLEVMEAGSFTLEAALSPGLAPGSAACPEAYFTPNEVCSPATGSWDGSILELNAVCEGDSVAFTIQNTGADMLQERVYIVIEDDLVMLQDEVQLNNLESVTFKRAANGATQRLQLSPGFTPAVPAAPGIAIELCGAGAQDGGSTGYLVDYPNHSGAPFTLQYCREIQSQDTAITELAAQPAGEGALRSILPRIPVAYRISFRNTTDSLAQLLSIDASLSPGFYPGSLRIGACSHACTSALIADGNASFQLQETLTPGEQGYVSFVLDQRDNNPDGTQLETQAKLTWENGQVDTTNLVVLTSTSSLMDPDTGFIALGVYTEDDEPLTMLGGALLLDGDTLRVDTTLDNRIRFDSVPLGIGYQAMPFQGGSWNNGVTVFDQVLIAKHILGVGPLSTPYQLIAADVNQSESITIMDLVALSNAILDPQNNGVEGVPAWVFVHLPYVFPDPANPWYGIDSSMVMWSGCLEEVFAIPYGGAPGAFNADCIGVKIGDVNGDAAAFQQQPEERSAADWPLVWKPSGNGGAALVPGREGLSVSGFQLSFRGPERMAWETSQGFQLEAHYADGIWRLLAYRTMDAPLITDQPILQITIPESLEPVSSDFNRAYLSDGTPIKPVIAASGKEKPLMVAPNPARGRLIVQGQQQTPGAITLTLFNPQGQPVQARQWMAGHYWSGELQVGGLPAGLYWLQVETVDGIFGERVVVQ